METLKAYAGKLFAVCIVLLLVLVSFSRLATTQDARSTDGSEATAGQEPESSGLPDEDTKFYHGRAQDSFGAGLDIGSAVGAIYDIAVGDLDNDGDEDIVTASTGFPVMFPAILIIWENDGTPFDAGWSSMLVATFGVAPEDIINSIDVADLDNDGDLDIVAGYNNTIDNVLIWGNPLDSGLGAPFADPWVGGPSGIVVGTAAAEVNEVAVGDFNVDGDIDIVTVDNNIVGVPNILIWRNSGNPFAGAWSSQNLNAPAPAGMPKLSVAVADLDNDGDPDVVTGDDAGGIWDWENPRELMNPFSTMWSGGLGNNVFVCFSPVNSIDAGDLDHDGDLDLGAGCNGGNFMEVIIENPLERRDPFMPPPWAGMNIGGIGPVWELELGDLDGDGWLDTMTVDDLANVRGSENDQTPLGTPWLPTIVGDVNLPGRGAVALADFDLDGDLDIAAGGSNSVAFVWNNTLVHRNMPYNFSVPAMTNTGPLMVSVPLRSVDSGDIDNDGDPDAVTCSASDSGNIYVWNNSSPFNPNLWATAFIDSNLVPARFFQDCKLADLDNDGDLDIVAGGSNLIGTIAELRIWENPYDGGTGNPFNPTAFPWSGGAGVEISGGVISNPPARATILSVDVADFDGDGDLDIVSADTEPNIGRNGSMIWRNPLPAADPFVIAPWSSNTLESFNMGYGSIVAGDLDNDGDMDVAAGQASPLNSPVTIWNNTNSSGGNPWVGTWQTNLINMCMFNASVEMADLDNDGDLDIVCVSETDMNVFAAQNMNDPSTPLNEPFSIIWPVSVIGSLGPTKIPLSIVAGDLDNDGDDDVVTGDRAPGAGGPHNITVWTNSKTDGPDPWLAPWPFQRYQMVSGMLTGGINDLALADLDVRDNRGFNKGGDLDILHLSMNTPHLWLKENQGAQVTEMVFPTSTPPAPPYYDITNGANESLMRIDVTHNGVSWDNDTELGTWNFLFDNNGVPMTVSEIGNLIANFYVYRDQNGNDVWDPVADAGGFISSIIALTLPSGFVSLLFPESATDSDVVVPADTTETYFFVVELESDASIQTPNSWNVTFDPDGYGTGNWNEMEHEDEDTILTVREAPPVKAGVFRAVGGALDKDPPRIESVFLNGMSTLNYAICSNPPPGSVTLTAIIDDTSEGNSNVSGANYTTTPTGWPGIPMDPTDGAFDTPMEFANVSIDISGYGVGTYYFYVYGWDEVPNYNMTGPFATLVIADDCPPQIGPVMIDGLNTATYSVCAVSTVDITSFVDDTGLGDSNIGGANFTVGAQNWPGANMDASDGAFDSPFENVNITIDVSGWPAGSYDLYVYGWDAVPNYNTTSVQFATLNLIDDCPPLVLNVRLNGMPTLTIALGGGPVWVNATIDDTTTGNANIFGANYTVGIQMWPGTPMSAVVAPFDNPIEAVTNDPVPIDTSLWPVGTYDICVYGSDVLGNNNTTGACALLNIAPELMPPDIFNVWIDGQPSQSYGISSLPATFTLTASIDDELRGASFIGNVTLGGANYTLGPGNWPSSTPMSAVDGTWEDDIAENVTATIPTPTTPGIYVYCVYGWDQWFNYNTTGDCATLTVVDDMPPEIGSVLLDGLPALTVTVGTPSVDLTAALDETSTGQANIGGANYTVGVQNWPGIDVDPTDGAWDAIAENANKTIDISAWGVGTYDICVYGWDTAAPQNNNVTGKCAQLTINITGDVPPTIDAWNPGGTVGQSYTQGQVVTVTWLANDDNPLPATPINITYGVPGIWTTIAVNEANDGSYLWDTTSVPCPGTYWMNISAYDSIGQTTFDEGNYSFTIICAVDNPPTITEFEPGGTSGQTFLQGTTIDVRWTASDDNPLPASPINITYGSGSSWATIAANEANDGLYAWDTSSIHCGTYWINISVRDSIGQTAFDEGNNSFEITCPSTESPVIVSVVASPASQTSGQTVTITATVTDADTNLTQLTVTIEIRDASGALVEAGGMTYDSGSDTYTYSTSFELEGTYSVTVLAVDPDDNSDTGTGTFVITAPQAEESNWKPLVALLFAIILLLLGLMASYSRPIGLKGDLKKDRLMTFLGGVLPFVLAESATGVVSLATGALSIPPIGGAGLIVDVAILVIGILVILAIMMKGKPAATYGAEPQAPEGDADQPPAPPEGEAIGAGDQEAMPPPPAEPAGDEGDPRQLPPTSQ